MTLKFNRPQEGLILLMRELKQRASLFRLIHAGHKDLPTWAWSSNIHVSQKMVLQSAM